MKYINFKFIINSININSIFHFKFLLIFIFFRKNNDVVKNNVFKYYFIKMQIYIYI